MCRPQYALIFLAVAAIGSVASAQISIRPQAGVLILRNGSVLEGDITRAGDSWVITQGESSEIRMSATEVELFCGSLLEAYDFKAAHVSNFSIKSRLDLARWCLSNGLADQCRDQLAIAHNIEPKNSLVKELETQLKALTEAPPPPLPKMQPGMAAADLESAIRKLPRGSVEKFSTTVQPFLLNRCGANQCHGPNSKSEFRLLRPPQGQIVSKRFTERNLAASLKYLDRSNPDQSPLIVLPQQRHGNSLAPVFDKQSAYQLAEMIAWARLTTGSTPAPQAATAPATISPGNATLSQPTTNAATAATAAESPEPAAETVGMRVMRPPLDEKQATLSSKIAPQPPQFRDRFDPEIFNRQYHQK